MPTAARIGTVSARPDEVLTSLDLMPEESSRPMLKPFLKMPSDRRVFTYLPHIFYTCCRHHRL